MIIAPNRPWTREEQALAGIVDMRLAITHRKDLQQTADDLVAVIPESELADILSSALIAAYGSEKTLEIGDKISRAAWMGGRNDE